MKRARKGASPGESRKSPQSKRNRSSKPCHPGARRPLKLPDCSKFTAQPCRASSLRRASGSELEWRNHLDCAGFENSVLSLGRGLYEPSHRDWGCEERRFSVVGLADKRLVSRRP